MIPVVPVVSRGQAMRIAVTVLALVAAPIVGAAARAQAPRIVDVTHEPSHHLVLSNEHVRVFNVIVEPHATTLVHRHDRDYLFVTFGDADVSTTKVGDTAVRFTLHDGEVRFAAGGFAHSATVTGDRPFHNATIELLKPATHVQPCTESCAEPVPCSVVRGGSCPTVTRVMGADQWTAVTVTLPPSGRLDLVDGSGPVLVVAVSDVRLKRGGPATGDVSIRGAPGALGWVSASARPMTAGGAPERRALINESREPARFVMVEFRSGGA
jgi:quercetin dioxygenase-like cupin family protein